MSIYYLLLFSVVGVTIFYLIPTKYRKYHLFIYNIIFYLLCNACYLGLLLTETVLSFVIAKKIESNTTQKKKAKLWLTTGLIIIVTILCIFKYFNFFIETFHFSLSELILPIGISYYSFKILSYIIDVFRGKCKIDNSFIDYSVYIMFYPHLLCGPIARPQTILSQLKVDITYNSVLISEGLALIISGY